jgi:hypothetical protein
MRWWPFNRAAREEVEQARLVIVSRDEAEVARNKAMRAEQERLQRELGIDGWDDTQAWLRLHQLLKNHEDRIADIEARTGK